MKFVYEELVNKIHEQGKVVAAAKLAKAEAGRQRDAAEERLVAAAAGVRAAENDMSSLFYKFYEEATK